MASDTAGKGGLEDVVATSSRICLLDGDRGTLSYCGYDIHDLARHARFEETCFLLWHARLPTRAELGDLQTQLAEARVLPDAVLRLMRQLPPADGMDAMKMDMGGAAAVLGAIDAVAALGLPLHPVHQLRGARAEDP